MCSSLNRPPLKSEKKQSWIIFMTGNFLFRFTVNIGHRLFYSCFFSMCIMYMYTTSIFVVAWSVFKNRLSLKKPVPRLIYVLFHLSIEIFAHYFIHITHFMWCVLLKFTHTFTHSNSVCAFGFSSNLLVEFTCRIFCEFRVSCWMYVSANEWR